MSGIGAFWGWVAETAAWRLFAAWWRKMSGRPAFYPDRETLDRESPLAEKIRTTERIYAIWFTGTKSIQEIPDVHHVERLLMPNPNSSYLKYYQSAMDEERNLAEEIISNTKRAQNRGIKVRWLKEFLGYTLMIGNPRSHNSWAQIEIALPIIHGGIHPTFEFRKPKHEPTIKSLVEVFDGLWGPSFSSEPDE